MSFTLAGATVRELAGGSRQATKEAGKLSIELFNFDFMSLFVKLLVYTFIAILIDKIHFMLTSPLVNVSSTILNALGYNLPTTASEPNFFKKLFGEGYFGLTYWDLVKLGAILLVFIEFMRYYENEKKLGGSASPFTLGIFVLIMTLLSAFTVPEIIRKIKMRPTNQIGGV